MTLSSKFITYSLSTLLTAIFISIQVISAHASDKTTDGGQSIITSKQLVENNTSSGRSLGDLRKIQKQESAAKNQNLKPNQTIKNSNLSAWEQAKLWLRTKQIEITRTFSGYIDKYQKTNDFTFALLLVSASFLYGLVHAAGPGHGKVVVSSYVLANHQTMKRGILLAFISSMVQGTVAVVLVGCLVYVFGATGATIKTYGLQLTQLSFILIIGLGVYLLINGLHRRFISKQSTAQKKTVSGHAHHVDNEEKCGCGHKHIPDSSELAGKWDFAKIVSLVMSVGLRPCTGALYVLVFALVKGVFWIGALSVYAMALGTAITISIMTVAAVGGRSLAFATTGKREKLRLFAHDLFTLGGAVVIIAFGTLLFASTLGPTSPF